MNPTSFRLPFELPEDVHPEVKKAIHFAFAGLKDLNDAAVALAPQAGATSARPTKNIKAGQSYFDTTLGFQVFWSGSAWVNGSGSTV